MCIVLLFISCAGDPAVPEDTPAQSVSETPSAETDSSPEPELPVQEVPVPDKEPEMPAVTLSPEDDAVDYYYPEPEVTIPESLPAEPEAAVVSGEEPAGDAQSTGSEDTAIAEQPSVADTPRTITESPATVSKPAPVPESAPPVAGPPETARKQKAPGSGTTEIAKKPAPAVSKPPKTVPGKTADPIAPAAKDRSVSAVDSREPEQAPVPDSVPVDPESPVTDSASGAWNNEIRSPEPPPPVFRAEAVPSRSVTVPLDGFLEVWYPGTGWVYLGDASGLVGVSYDTRKIENRDTLFTFRARRSGNYILEFSRYDVLTDEFMQDALSVTVDEPVPGKKTTVRAPDFVLAGIQKQEEQSGEYPAASAAVIDEPVLSTPPTMDVEQVSKEPVREPREMLKEAQSRLSSGDASGALEMLDRFFEMALDELDEGWYLRGQSYEANSAARNIRKALEAYETVVSAYPDSTRWKEADERIRYIKQFYFRVR